MTYQGIKKIRRSVQYAVKGYREAYRRDLSFRLEVLWGIPIYVIVGYLLFPFSEFEFLFFIFSYLFILSAELLNTAFERMLERIHPEEHALIGISKDIGSAAVLTAFVFAIIVVCVLAFVRWG